ncbi:MAG: MEDS domain-containing protein [Candidatus Limnocylindrales bacterium]
MASERVISLGFTAERFPAGTHMCYIYNDDNERREVVSKYVESGLQGSEKVGYFVDLMSPQDMRAHLSAHGIDLPSDIDAPGLSITRALDTYCGLDSTFLPERMLENLRSMYSSSIGEGYAGARATGEMSWALQGMPGSERLIEYEALINTVVREYPTTAVCQYDARRFDGATLFDVLNVHPMMIVRGQVVRNPYYVAPELFLTKHVAAR